MAEAGAPGRGGARRPNGGGRPPAACLIADMNTEGSVSDRDLSLSSGVGLPSILDGRLGGDFWVPGASPSPLGAGRCASSVVAQVLGVGRSGFRGADQWTCGVDRAGRNFTFTARVSWVDRPHPAEPRPCRRVCPEARATCGEHIL